MLPPWREPFSQRTHPDKGPRRKERRAKTARQNNKTSQSMRKTLSAAILVLRDEELFNAPPHRKCQRETAPAELCWTNDAAKWRRWSVSITVKPSRKKVRRTGRSLELELDSSRYRNSEPLILQLSELGLPLAEIRDRHFVESFPRLILLEAKPFHIFSWEFWES